MATPAQVAANRANSQKSTGPKTESGKARSARNHLSNGFSSNATLIPGEDPEEFKALMVALALEHEPVTETEQILVEKMAVNQWLSMRAFRLQTEAFVNEMLQGNSYAIPKDLGLLIRYHTAAERAFHKAHNELLKAKKQRLNSEIGFVPQNPGEPAGRTAPKRKNEPLAVEITWCAPDRPAESAPSAAPEPPSAPEFIKNAA